MKRSVYNEKSATAEGRKNLHAEMLAEIAQRLDKLANNAPQANREKINAMFSTALQKMEKLGNSDLYGFFADEEIRDDEFIGYVQDIIKDDSIIITLAKITA